MLFCFWAYALITLLSYALSPNSHSAKIPSIKVHSCVQSAVVPVIINTLTGIPSASAAKCIFVLSPLLYVPCPDFLPQLLSHEDEPWHGSRQSSTIRSHDHQWCVQVSFPTLLAQPNAGIAWPHYSSFRIQVVNLVTARLRVESKRLRWWIVGYRVQFHPIVHVARVKVVQAMTKSCLKCCVCAMLWTWLDFHSSSNKIIIP